MLGNLVTELPAHLGALTSLRMLVVNSNRLTALPDSISALSQLTELGAAGNRLTSLPDNLGALSKASLIGSGLFLQLTQTCFSASTVRRLCEKANNTAFVPQLQQAANLEPQDANV